MNPIKYILTDEQNQWDIGILLWVAGVCTFLYRGWTVTPVDLQSYGIGFAAVLSAGGALKWIRDKTSPGLTQTGSVTGPSVTATTTNSAGTQQK